LERRRSFEDVDGIQMFRSTFDVRKGRDLSRLPITLFGIYGDIDIFTTSGNNEIS